MDKNLDAKIKEILQEKDDIVVPINITKGIDKTLQSLSNRKSSNKKKIIVVASVALLLIVTPLGVKAVKDIFYTYIPSTGNIVSTDNVIYLLDNPINKRVGNRKVTLNEVSYDKESKTIIVSVQGNGQLPSNKAIIKINKDTIKSNTSNISKLDDTSVNASWGGSYFFEYNKQYNENNIKLELTLDNGSKAEFNCKLSKAKQVNNINELGPSAINKNIEITAILEEENNKLDVTFLNNLPQDMISVNYGKAPYPINDDLDKTDDGIITLKDNNGNVLKAKLAEDTDLLAYNRFYIDTKNLKKPFTIEIPYIQIITHKNLNSSDIIELPIPNNDEKININKTIMINTKDEMFKDANSEVNIISIQRDGENYTIELDYPDNKDREVKMLDCVVVPAGKSITSQGEEWFEGGLSGNISKDGNRTITFKLPYPDSNKLFIKVLGNEYKIKGPWNINIE
ncbi:hypothetical protein HF520_07355 [Romboutsia sp. CE17]|uniref:hypothetical protein n=1 Tax=Romboutsia sp. CE17 TaxID=2724150 RepID=UPI001442CEE7|nr:hypothetical protein [Romboutsia sp. CE17]QJA08772.1 hypothetical protein HF520_07355 [Romboutsia sp. CE17]